MARRAAAQTKDTPELEKQEAPQLAEPVEVDISEPEAPAAPEQVEVETAPAPSAPEPPPIDEEKETLRRRVAEMEQAERLARQALMEAQRQQQTNQVQVQRSQRQVFDAQYDSVVNTMGAAQADLAAAKQELKLAFKQFQEGNLEAGDSIAELNERIGRASADIRELERRKDYMDAQIEQWKNQPRRQQPPPQQQPQQQPTVEQVIANSGLPDRAKNWLRQHQDYIQDPAKNAKMQEMHYVAKHQAGGEFTDAYFDRMEELLGHKPSSGNGASQPATSHRQSAPVSAPPTREAPSMATGRAPQPTKVTLNAEQREVAATIAESRKITQAEAERIYARELLRMQAEKKDGRHQ